MDFLDRFEPEQPDENLIIGAAEYGKLKASKKGVVDLENRDRLRLMQWLDSTHPTLIYWFDLAGESESTTMVAATLKCKGDFKVHDLIVDLPVHPYHGLRIELKRSNFKLYTRSGTMIKNEHVRLQDAALKRTHSMGYQADFASGFDDAREKVQHYIMGRHKEFEKIRTTSL